MTVSVDKGACVSDTKINIIILQDCNIPALPSWFIIVCNSTCVYIHST